uniref:Uncharacterized protein n=1 Tax=Pseudomonas monteilii TaxID=76759 RepID=A0A6B7Q475_9PSED|nr:hypothetical protein [Pseudomonas monteilii]QFX76422.1 hypothetical protein [Pseudomonas monteilii]
MCNRNLIEEWSWDGSSIDSIKRFAAELGIGLQKFVESFFCVGWPETVPEPYRGVIKGPISRDFTQGENSLAGHQNYTHILAIDLAGAALVMDITGCLYTDGETQTLVERPAADALAKVDEYRLGGSAYRPEVREA